MADDLKPNAMLAIREAKNLTNMLRGLMALEDEIGDLSKLEKAYITRKAALAAIDDQVKAAHSRVAEAEAKKEEALAAAEAIKADAQKAAEQIISGAKAAAERDAAAGAAQREEALAGAAAARKAKDDAVAAANAAKAELSTVQRDIDNGKSTLAALKAELAALRNRLTV